MRSIAFSSVVFMGTSCLLGDVEGLAALVTSTTCQPLEIECHHSVSSSSCSSSALFITEVATSGAPHFLPSKQGSIDLNAASLTSSAAVIVVDRDTTRTSAVSSSSSSSRYEDFHDDGRNRRRRQHQQLESVVTRPEADQLQVKKIISQQSTTSSTSSKRTKTNAASQKSRKTMQRRKRRRQQGALFLQEEQSLSRRSSLPKKKAARRGLEVTASTLARTISRANAASAVDVAVATTANTAKKTNPSDEKKKKKTKSPSATDSKFTRYRLLSRQEEAEYTYKIRELRAAERLRDEMGGRQEEFDGDNRRQEREGEEQGLTCGGNLNEMQWADAHGVSVVELRRILDDGQHAMEQFVSTNIGLVTSIARKYHSSLKRRSEIGIGSVGTILTLQDLIQEGNMGVMEAAERFEPERGFRFSTYATYWIRQRILRCISDTSRTIRLPASVLTMLSKIYKAKRTLKYEQYGGFRDPTVHELAQYLEVPTKKIIKCTERSRNGVSLESPLVDSNPKSSTSFSPGRGQDGRRTLLGDTIPSDAPTPIEDVEADYLRRDVRTFLADALMEQERNVIERRYGLCDGRPRTIDETAELLGLSKDQIRVVETKAMNKLRHPQRNYRLKGYVVVNDDENSSISNTCVRSNKKNLKYVTRSSRRIDDLSDREFYRQQQQRRRLEGVNSQITTSKTSPTTIGHRRWFF